MRLRGNREGQDSYHGGYGLPTSVEPQEEAIVEPVDAEGADNADRFLWDGG